MESSPPAPIDLRADADGAVPGVAAAGRADAVMYMSTKDP